jgi:hypothetical protein
VAAGGPGRNAENTGIQFPQSADGHRRTSETTKAIFAAALERVNPEMARALQQDRSWRQQYPRYLRELTERSLERPEVAIATAQAGLATAWNAFEFWRNGQPHALDAAMAAPSTWGLRTATVEGRNLALPPRWEVPYRGQLLAGDALLRQIDVWERAGVMEPSHAEALRQVQRHPEWLDLSDRTFALLGAGAEAGPFSWLMRWRAHVAAVDLKRPQLWARLIEQARAGNGRLLAPVPPSAAATSAEEAGADLLTEAPEIAQWLLSLDRPLDIASLAYLDGARHTRVSMAMDAIATTVSRARPRTSLACMATPTDVFAVPEEIIRAAQSAYRERALLKRVSQAGLRTVSRGRFFRPHEGRLIESSTGRRYGTVDCIVLEQGPSYALAKRLQQWRAVVAREAGQVVSINIAPSTTTHSVVKNPLLAAAYRGADLFGVETFAPETTNSIMAALWVHDLRNPTSPAQPSTPLHHPLELLMLGANHGGMWRLPYLPRSVLPLSALVGFTRRPPRKGSA